MPAPVLSVSSTSSPSQASNVPLHQRQWETIRREDLDHIAFPEQDVLNSAVAREERRRLLERACELGNLYKHKVHIYFLDAEGNAYHLYTTIWAVTERVILLKEGRWIPIRAIQHILLI